MESAALFCMRNGRTGGDRRSSLLDEWPDNAQSLKDAGHMQADTLDQKHSNNSPPSGAALAASVMDAPVMNSLGLPPGSSINQDGQLKPEQMLRFILKEKQEQTSSSPGTRRGFPKFRSAMILKRTHRKHRRAFWVWLDSTLPIILPMQRVRRYWDFLILVFVAYNSISVPLEASFAYTKTPLQRNFEDIADVLFALDVFYTFRTAYVDEQGMVVRDGLKIAKRYCATWFPIDLAASLPLEIIVLWFGVSNNNLTYLAMLKTPRLLRLGRLLRFLEKQKNANVFRIMRLMALMCLVAHWTACVWHLLITNFSDLEFSIPEGSILDKYLSCFYGSFLLMIGDNVNPTNNVERVFCCVMLVLGANLYATIVGNMALLVSTLNATTARHQQRAETIQEVMRYLKVSQPIQQRVQEYYDFLQTYTHPGSDLAEYLRELPSTLRNDMSAELFAPHLERVQLFDGVQTYFIHWLCNELQMQVYLAGEHLYHYNEVCGNLHICMKGKVAIVTPEGFLNCVHQAGQHFSVDALISPQPRQHDAIALSNSDIMSLNASVLTRHMRKCSESSAAIRRNAMMLLYGENDRDALPIEQTRPILRMPGAKSARSKPSEAECDREEEPILVHGRSSGAASEGSGALLVAAFEEEHTVVLNRIDRALKTLIAKVERLEELRLGGGEPSLAGQESDQDLDHARHNRDEG